MRYRSTLRLLWGAFLALALQTGAVRAAVIAVDGTTCTLVNAILSANTDAAVGGCTAGTGADTLVLGADVVLTTPVTADVEGGPSGLPAITSQVSIAAGAGTVIERSSALECAQYSTPFRLFEVASSGVLTLSGLSLRNGCVAGGGLESWSSGGAVLVRSGGDLRILGCQFEGNEARGIEFSRAMGLARGGAIAVLAGKLQVAASSFTDNKATGIWPHGGAIAIEGGELTELVTSEFANNHAGLDPAVMAQSDPAGGAISLRETQTGTLAYLVVAGNTLGVSGTASGGGIEVLGGRVRELRDSFFSGNVAQAGYTGVPWAFAGRGGGLANFGIIESILRTTFSGNQALGYGMGEGRGGGLDNRGRIGAIVSSTFTGNVAQGGVDIEITGGDSFGGGLANVGEIGRIVSSTFVGNRCPQSAFMAMFQGGGIYTSPDFEAWYVSVPPVTVVGSLLAGNEANGAPDCWSSVPFFSGGFNLAQSADGSCHFFAASDIVGVDPQVEPLADNGCTIPLPGGACLATVALAATSPALDAGLCSAAGTEIDARGAVRPLDLAGVLNAPGSDGCDIGAYERDAPLAEIHLGLSVAESADPVYGGSGAGNLTYTVALSSVGAQDATAVVVTPALLLPAGATLDAVTPSIGAWDGSDWSLAALASGDYATLTYVLTVGLGTAGGPDAVGLSAVVTSAPGHSGELAADAETTTVVEGVFVDGLESGGTSAWSLTVGGS